MNQLGKNRRIQSRGTPRQSVHPPLDLPLSSLTTRYTSTIYNYSPGGLYVELPDLLQPGSRVSLDWPESAPPPCSPCSRFPLSRP